jgi:branched-chain amino acid transport system ATP-binding protein
MATPIAISGLSLAFGGQQVLDDVDLEVAAGAAVGIIGPNGAGKTSIFNCISRIYRPSAGRIMLGDLDMSSLRSSRVSAAGVARSFQGTALPPRATALENVMLGSHTSFRATWIEGVLGLPRSRRAERRARERAREALSQVGLLEEADTPMELLPLGHQKLVDIARCLVGEPQVLLLDEPVAATSQTERDRVSRLLADLIAERDMTLLLVEHDVSFVADLVDETVVLDLGKVIARGNPREVLEDPRVVASYLGGAG